MNAFFEKYDLGLFFFFGCAFFQLFSFQKEINNYIFFFFISILFPGKIQSRVKNYNKESDFLANIVQITDSGTNAEAYWSFDE